MSFAPRLLFVLLISTAASVWAAPFTGVRDGEKFTYKVGFAIFSRAGEIIITGRDDATAGKDVIKVTAETNSRGFVRGLYTFDNKAEAAIDKATSRLLSVHESGTDKDRTTDSDFVVDYQKRVATYTDRARPERSRELTLPEGGDPLDLISALVQTRDWNLKPGEKRDVVVQFTRELYAITITAEGYEEIRTPMGKFKTLVLVPRMEKDPKGMFKRGGEIKVWIAQDGSRLPVKMQLKLNFGTAQLLLSGYEPPTK
jgi:hypothetical protein